MFSPELKGCVSPGVSGFTNPASVVDTLSRSGTVLGAALNIAIEPILIVEMLIVAVP
jgi:hypothetical protein